MTCVGKEGGAFVTRAAEGITNYRFIVIKSEHYAIHIGVGVWENKARYSSKNGWSVFLKDGKKKENKTYIKYGKKMKPSQDEIIKVTVDTNKGTMSFAIGDQDYGEAFQKEALKGNNVFAFVGLSEENDQVRVIEPEE